jgi:serine/threonine protein kinase
MKGLSMATLKPFNLMLDDSSRIRIVDFGLSRRRGEMQALPDKNIDIGTPYYAAPEQLGSSHASDHRADLYSAGVILFRMLTGQLPGESLKSAGEFHPMLSEAWDDFFSRALAANPARRFADADEMINHLDRLASTVRAEESDHCQMPDDVAVSDSGRAVNIKPVTLRDHPKKILVRHARKTFDLNPLSRPNRYIRNAFQVTTKETVTDMTTGLTWQQAGSKYPMPWENKDRYLNELNQNRFGGHDNWRMPTMNELLSLLNPWALETFCRNAHFNDTHTWLWSADQRSRRAVWTIELDIGFVSCSDRLDRYFVKAVCTA